MTTFRPTLRRLIKASSLFAALAPEDIDGLVEAATLRTFSKDTDLWHRGETPDALGVVVQGRLDLVDGRELARRRVVRRLEAGDVVGLSIVAGAPQTADFVAKRGLTLAIIPGGVVRRMIRCHSDFALQVIRKLGELVGLLSDEKSEQSLLPLIARIGRWLGRNARGRREIRITHEELAQQVGATRARVSRALKELEKEGYVSLHRGRIEIVRPLSGDDDPGDASRCGG
jgi:CRP-like cAMP-binding protein